MGLPDEGSNKSDPTCFGDHAMTLNTLPSQVLPTNLSSSLYPHVHRVDVFKLHWRIFLLKLEQNSCSLERSRAVPLL